MALQRDTLYAGRFSTATSAHPQGAFKNRTTSTAQDGSYLEAQWLNDWDGFFGSLLNGAGLTPDGNVDAVGASQYYTALSTLIADNFNRTILTSPVGTSRNLKSLITAASATATFTADELVLGTALNGQKYHISSLSASVNLATTGAGGMDTGSAPVSGKVAIYAIYNPTTSTSALLAVSVANTVAPEVYGGSNMPSGYTASALLTVLLTNSSGQFYPATVSGRDVQVTSISTPYTYNGAGFTSPATVSLVSVVPANAKTVKIRELLVNVTSSAGVTCYVTPDNSAYIGQCDCSADINSGIATVRTNFELQLTTAQTVYVRFASSNSANVALYVRGYSI